MHPMYLFLFACQLAVGINGRGNRWKPIRAAQVWRRRHSVPNVGEVIVQSASGGTEKLGVSYQEPVEAVKIGTVVSMKLFVTKKFFLSLHSQSNPDVVTMMIICDTDTDKITFTSLVRNEWDVPEVRRLPFQNFRLVNIDIIVRQYGYEIVVNSQWSKMYEFRHAYELFELISFTGEVSVRSIQITEEGGEDSNEPKPEEETPETE